MQNKLIVSGSVSTQKQQQCVANNAKWQQVPELPAFSKFRLASWRLATPVFCLIVMKQDLSPSFSSSLSPIFTSLYSPCFLCSPNFIAGRHSPMYNSWSDMLVFTHHVPTAMLWRPEGVSSMPACNLLTHTEQPAHTSPHQLHSIPGMALSLTRGSLWSSCPSKRHRQRE